MKRIAVIGKGTAGAISALESFHRSRILELDSLGNVEIQWYFDSNISAQEVGEGTNLILPRWLSDTMFFKHEDIKSLDGTNKIGISKSNWGAQDYMHHFVPPSAGMHVNAVKLQSFILEFLKKQKSVSILDDHITHDQIDADLILDCSGRPKNFDDFVTSPYIPVNSVYVTQCFWDTPKFNYSITDAAQHGWVFGIPLQNRCSIGYLYNNQVSTLDQVKEDVESVFQKYGLTPSEKTNSFSFNNYYRKVNFHDNVVYNGNASFFLEPLEATTLGNVVTIAEESFSYIKEKSREKAQKSCNEKYHSVMDATTAMIMIHYYSGSKFKTPFWEFAEDRARSCIKNFYDKDPKFSAILKTINDIEFKLDFDSDQIYPVTFLNLSVNQPSKNRLKMYHVRNDGYGSWDWNSWAYNILRLGIKDKLRSHLEL
jgi:hypothetical protein